MATDTDLTAEFLPKSTKYRRERHYWVLTETRPVAGDIIIKLYSVHLKHPVNYQFHVFLYPHNFFLYFPDKIFVQCQWRSLNDEEYFSTGQNFEIHDEIKDGYVSHASPISSKFWAYANRNNSQILHGGQNWMRGKFYKVHFKWSVACINWVSRKNWIWENRHWSYGHANG